MLRSGSTSRRATEAAASSRAVAVRSCVWARPRLRGGEDREPDRDDRGDGENGDEGAESPERPAFELQFVGDRACFLFGRGRRSRSVL